MSAMKANQEPSELHDASATWLVTGGAGFIGANLIRWCLKTTDVRLVTVDKLTYAGNLDSLRETLENPRHTFIKADICDRSAMDEVFARHRPTAVMHLAAESHVDRSIDGPGQFIQTNVVGTFSLLEAARHYWCQAGRPGDFRFLHVSTDEVFGALDDDEAAFTESTAHDPHSPYSASKAASDHLVGAWHHTYGLPTLITHCSNNYGPLQFPEKLIPIVILKALARAPIPVYGDGMNVRDWLYVEDQASALITVLRRGRPGASYNIGGGNEVRNIDLVRKLCAIMDAVRPVEGGRSHADLIRFVADRPGHDRRYAMDASHIRAELGWKPEVTLEDGLRNTVQWYLDNPVWCESVLAGKYRMERLGTGPWNETTK
jgi:dTDP-glucose 4,6-dehydratase